MRIIIEPTAHKDQHKVIIEAKSDDLDFDGTVDLFRYALLGWGFDEKSVNDFFEGVTNAEGE